MNTDEEIQQAFVDFKQAQNGFEARKHWESKIRHLAQAGKDEI